MKKGVILSVNKRFVTLLTPEGEFLKTKRQEREYEVGEEITFSPAKQKFTLAFSNFHSSFKKTAVLSIASTFLILFSILPSYFPGPVSAYMTIDVNPSIELELDDDLEVLKLTGLNEDGKLVIGQLKDWKGKDIKTVTNRVVETTKQLGYLKGNKQIVVSTTLLEKDKELDKNLKEEIKEISEQDNVSNTKMKVIQATKSDRKQAREQGISTGKYLEKKLNEDKDKDKVKVNKREPAPAPDKKVEDKGVNPKEKSVTLSTENKSDGEKKKENNEIEIKQKQANEAKPTERKNAGMEVTKIKKQNEREGTIGKRKRDAINGQKEKSNEKKGKSESDHSNQSKNKQKNEKNDKKFDVKKVSSAKENNNDHLKHESKNKQANQVKEANRDKQAKQHKQNKQDWDKSKRGIGNNGKGNGHND
ncbi:anti-sigma factor domain-containing protein [Peribacillus frigoritolerans]|uniref:anti-sigma factor domain-containing protein n=1 Tax=Peribacillus frigoritolerans TaxID=450367 RepID=UPI0021AB0968|nr:anti-sigma factor domain-containing protein [Peribacillus frigoritolerans]MCT4476631.1 anti-sigma factor domain-containing protein [Peribacillus frigoritolerans]